MEDFWARFIEPSGKPGSNYWEYFAERLAQLASIPRDAAILDLGTCDGNVLFKAVKKMNAQCRGVGADIHCYGFRDGVLESIQRGWEEKVAFVQMDGKTLGFLPGTFDNVLSNFVGWDDCFDFERMKFLGPDKIMSEIIRVLRPGGQVGIGSWVEQSDIDWIIGAFNNYLPENKNNISCYSKENPEGLKEILESGGFKDIHVYVETTRFVSPDSAAWWRQMQQAANEYFEKMPEIEGFKEQIFSDLYQFQLPEGITFEKTVAYAFGIKP
jgi:SAM-dependent methyltransferase